MTLFALMDEWLSCTGGSDDDWLSLGLDVLDGWHASGRPGDPASGQPHLTGTLLALRARRCLASAPDPVALTLWFDECGRLDPSLLDRLAELGGPALGIRVRRLVRALAGADEAGHDPAAALVHAAHRTALASPSAPHLTPVRTLPGRPVG